MLNTSHRKWSGRRGAFRDRKGQREDEVNKPEDAENQDEFDEVSICYSFVDKFLLIPQALKVPSRIMVYRKIKKNLGASL